MPTRPITADQKADADRLKVLFEVWKEERRVNTGQQLSQEEIAHTLMLGQSALSQRLNGRLAINRDFAAKIAALIGKSVADFSPRLAAEIEGLARHSSSSDGDFANLKLLSVRVAAGRGGVPHLEEELGSLKFRRDFLKAVGVSEASGVVVTVKGAGMEPTIADGAVLLVNRANREPRANAIYVFYRGGEGLVVKRIVKVGGRWIARSDNDDREAFPDFAFENGAMLIGRAVWMGVKL